MALSIVERPPKYSSVYKPMLWGVVSSRYPNTDPRTSNLPIVSIRQPTAAELASYPSLLSTDTIIVHAYVDPSTYFVGQTISISGTSGGLYSGVFRVTARPSPTITVISATYVGTDNGGVFGVYYNNLTAFFRVTVDGRPTVTLKAKPFLINRIGDPLYGRQVFEVDVREVVQRGLDDVFKIITPTSAVGIIKADGYVATGYSVAVTEGYDQTTATGTTFVELKSSQVVTTGYVGVNAVQPFHRTDISGGVTLDYDDELAAYQVTNNTTEARFLTYDSRTAQEVRSDEPAYLAFLWNGTANQVLKVIYSTYDASGATIATTRVSTNAPKYAGVIPIGPAAFTLPANCAYYQVAIFNQNENRKSEVFRYNVTSRCEEADRRMFWLNKLGGIDSFTFIGREDQSVTARRGTISKPNMYNYGVATEYQRRVIDVDVQREYSVMSHWIRPVVVDHLAKDLFESPNVRLNVNSTWWTEVLILTDSTVAGSTNTVNRRFTFSYALGVDNLSQRR